SSVPIFSAAVAGTNSAYIGDGYTNNFEGEIDEVRIWNTARTQAEIQDNLVKRLRGSQEGLVAYYSFDEDSVDGTTINDVSDNATFKNGDGNNFVESVDLGNAVSLDGNDDYVESKIGNFPTTEITLEGWFKRTDNQGLGTPLLSYASSDLNNNEVLLYEQISTNSILVFIGNRSIDTNIAIPDEDWHHWAVTWRSSDGQVLLYRDGTQVFSGNLSQGDVLESGGSLVLGQEQDSVGGGFASDQTYAGQIDEVRIWNTVRSAAQIQANINTSLQGTEDGLVTYYSFDEDTVNGTIIADIADNDGTLTNGDETNFVDSEIPTFKGYVDIELGDEVTNQPGVILNYQIESDSTATQDEDFYNSQTDVSTTDSEPQTDSIFIAEGEDSARIYLTALPDAVVEGDENIKLTLLPDFNKALSLDGSDDYVDLGFTLPQSYTKEAWIKRGAGNNSNNIISGNSNHALWAPSQQSFKLSAGHNGSWYTVQDNEALEQDTWYHVAVTYDEITKVMRLYKNGDIVDTANNVDPVNGGNNTYIGRYSSGYNFDGQIDEARIWNTARTETEIQDTLYATLNGDETNLVAYYNFNDDSVDGNTISDVTTNSNDGTLQDNSNLALSLDGVDDYVAVSSQLPTTNMITIEARIKPILDGTWNPILNYDGWSTGDIHLQFRPNNQLQFAINGTNSKISSYNFNSNEWYDIAITYIKSDGFAEVFVNGEPIDYFNYFDDNLQSFPSVAANSFKIGGWSDNNGNLSRFFNGEIDEVRIWSGYLDATEIQENYSGASIDPNSNGLLGYYTFNDGTANDLSSSNRNGTVNGASFVDSSNLVVADNLTNSLAYDPFATNGATYGIQSTQSAEITIQDSDNYVVDIVIANKFAEDLSDAANYVVVDENGDATFQVKLTSEPTENATVSVSINSTTNDLTFTPINWDTYQSVTVSGISDGSNITLTNTVGNYTNQTKQLFVSAKSNDEVTILELTEGGAELELTPTVSISSATNPEATEGNETESGVFTVSLDTPAPEGGLVIPFSVSSTATEGTDYNLYADSFTYSGESALSFDGVDDYVSIPDSDNIDFGTDKDFTVETWVKADSNQADLQYSDNSIIEKWSGSGSYPFVIRYLNSSGKIRAARYDGSNAPGINSSTTINDGQFHHIAFVKNGETLSLYIDGNLEDSTTDTTTASTQNTSPLHIGKRGNNRNYFKGEVDEVRIWETARTEEEIRQNLYSKLEGTEDGLAAYYNFDELNENISDVTENGNDGTSYVTRQGLSLDGTNDYVAVGNILPNAYTKEAWIKRSSGNKSNNIISSGNSTNVHAFFAPSGQSFKLSAGHSGSWYTVQDNEALEEDTWYHVAVTYDGSSEMKLYKNGVLVDSATGVAPLGNNIATNIGKHNNGYYFVGDIDEVRIWETARTQSEIQDNLYKQLEGTEENLVAYYNFDNDSGTTITDSTGNNDGTLNNGDGNNLVASTIGYPLTDWETTKTPVVKIAEGETEATITVSKIDNDIAEAAGETVTVTLEDWANYDLNSETSKQSATVTLKDDDSAGIEFAKLDTVGSVDNIAQEFIVSNDYDTTTGQVGLTLNNGNNSYTFAAGTELTFDGGAVVTVDSSTTIAATGETLLNVTFASDSPTQEITADEISEIELVNIELSSFATTDTDAIAIFNVSLAQAPTEDVTVTLTDANGTATGTVSFTNSNWDISQSVRMTVEEGTSESAFNLGVSTTTATQGDINYGDRGFNIPISTETVATSLEFYNNTVVTSEVATIELEVTSDYAN
ncbi:MAG: LamG-like jellyroll fold domain-containing protein, partial [Rivularia sp. (in: cyanobacteria)]